MSYRKKFSFEVRQQGSEAVLKKYPDRIPIIVEKYEKSDIPDIDKTKFLVPRDLTMGQFLLVIRKRIKLQPEQAIFTFINNTLPPVHETMENLYNQMKDKDGFLYVVYSGESTFGKN
jgi:GABA(A) receptor-associated protein